MQLLKYLAIVDRLSASSADSSPSWSSGLLTASHICVLLILLVLLGTLLPPLPGRLVQLFRLISVTISSRQSFLRLQIEFSAFSL